MILTFSTFQARNYTQPMCCKLKKEVAEQTHIGDLYLEADCYVDTILVQTGDLNRYNQN